MDTLFEEKWNGIHFPNCASVKLLEDKGEGLLREPLETVSTNCIWHLAAHLKPVDIVPRQDGSAMAREARVAKAANTTRQERCIRIGWERPGRY